MSQNECYPSPRSEHLHDVGHGPFSHVFERVTGPSEEDVLKHEDWTGTILRDSRTEINCTLKEHAIDIESVVALICDSASSKLLRVAQPAEPFLKDIVSSQLDADRMDYLLRDSLMTGSRYGLYDSEWVLNALAVGEVPFGSQKLLKLCLDASKGTGAIEGLLFARSLMTQYVYGHKATRAYESEMICTLRLASQCVTVLPADTPTPMKLFLGERGRVDINTYLLLDDEVTWWSLRRWAAWEGSGARRADPKVDALKRHALRLVRRHVPWHTDNLHQRKYMNARKLIRALVEHDDPLQYECYADDVSVLPYKNLRTSKTRGADDEQAYFGDIYLIGKSGTARPLPEINDSPTLLALNEELKMFRFHYDREFEKKFAGLKIKFGVC